MSSYFGGSHTSSYRQVNMGHGNRSNWTLENARDKGDFNLDYGKLGSIQNDSHTQKLKTTKKGMTFGLPYSRFEKAVVKSGLQQYYGKGL